MTLFTKGAPDSSLPPFLCHGRNGREGGCLQGKERVLRKNPNKWLLNLRLLASRTVRNKSPWTAPDDGIFIRKPEQTKTRWASEWLQLHTRGLLLALRGPQGAT